MTPTCPVPATLAGEHAARGLPPAALAPSRRLPRRERQRIGTVEAIPLEEFLDELPG